MTPSHSSPDYGGPTNGAIHETFGYDGRGELTAAGTWLGDLTAGETSSTLMSGRQHEFSYDGIGNRRWSNTSGAAGTRDSYTVNELNQYVSRENNTLSVGGTVANDPAIKVVAGANAVAASGRHGRHWGDNMLVDNLAGPYQQPIKVFAGKAGAGSGGTDLLSTKLATAFLPPALQTFSYDADGNMLSDGVWNYTWDAENRLVAMETRPDVIGFIASPDARRLEFKYDYLSRRIEKLVRSGFNGSTYTNVVTQTRFIYDGWSMIAEYAVSGSSSLVLSRSYTWGLDIARSLKDAGGVGALLQVADHRVGKAYFASYDGNGNVVALFDGNSATGGGCAASYEYSPFGELVRASVSDSNVADQPFRHATQFYDQETRLYAYIRRYYDPKTGRWLSRDPIEEKGGLHLYGFVGNNPVNAWDVLGQNKARIYAGDAVDPVTGKVVSNTAGYWDIDDDGYAGSFNSSYGSGGGNDNIDDDGEGDGGDGTVGNGGGDDPNKPDLSKLPGCSELRKQLADGTYHPALTVESFIPGQSESGFHGDGRGFIDTPSNPTDGTTSRVSVTSNYYPTLGGSSGGTQIQAPSVTYRNDPSWLAAAPSIVRTGTVSPQTVNVSYNNVVYMNVGYSSTNPFGPSGIMQMIGLDIRANVEVQIDLNTGMLTGSVNRSAFPANQVFFNGQSVYQGDASPKGARGLLDNASGKINSTQACDPSK